MNFEAVPIIKVEIERINHSIKSMLGVHGSELGEMIASGVEKAVAAYDIDAKVITAVHEAIDDEINRYFSSGDGRRAIRKFVADSFDPTNRQK